jgi:hypothetical protein
MSGRDSRAGYGLVRFSCRWANTNWISIDLKATALLKLVYLEMFGHDMSWASFHVLEVMSSAKYLQKRVGYLGAVQSFRPDTEVLMLATNLLKKVGHLSPCTMRMLNISGFNFHLCYHDVPPYYNASPRHYIFVGYVCTIRPPPTLDTFASRHPEKDDRDVIQTGPGLPRDTKACVAQDKGEADGRGRRS